MSSNLKTKKKILEKAILASIASDNINELKRYAKEAHNLDPKDIDILYYLGVAYFRTLHFDQSRFYFKKALSIDPKNILVLLGLTKLELGEKKIPDALTCIKKVFSLDAKNIDVLNTYGSILIYQTDLKNAFIMYQKALVINPDDSKTLSNLGTYFLYTGNMQKAEEFLLKALHFNPKEKDSLLNLSQVSFRQGQYYASIDWLKRALLYYPEDLRLHQHLAIMYLGLFEFQKGWEEYTYREIHQNNTQALDELPQNLNGKRFFIRHEQGLGDEIFFLRFISLLKARGAWIAYMPQTKLYNLLTTSQEIDLLVTKDDPLPAVDDIFFIGDLPKLLNINSIDLIPPPFSLTINQDYFKILQKEFEPYKGPFIGITWRGGVQKFGYLSKEIPLAELIISLKKFHCTVVILQRNPSDDEIQLLKDSFGSRLINASKYNDYLENMLCLLSYLDAYISVSNTNIHLAASLQKKCHIMVPFPAEWRWGYDKNESSPWYKTFKIYRQDSHQGSWESAFTQLANDLKNDFSQIKETPYQLDIINKSSDKIDELLAHEMYSEAQLLCEKILSLDQTNTIALIHLANILNITQQYEALINIIERIKKLQELH